MTLRPQLTKTFQFRIKHVALEIALVTPSSRLALAKREENEWRGEDRGVKHLHWEKGCKGETLFCKGFHYLATFLEPGNCLDHGEDEGNHAD